MARINPLLKESALHRITCQGERLLKVFVRAPTLSAPELALAERGMVEGIAGKAFLVGNCPNLLDSPFRAQELRDGNGAIQRDDWGRAYRH